MCWLSLCVVMDNFGVHLTCLCICKFFSSN